MVFSQTPYEDEPETDWKTHFPYSLFFLNAADRLNNSKYGTEICIVQAKTAYKHTENEEGQVTEKESLMAW